jgi:hypothetical protein
MFQTCFVGIVGCCCLSCGVRGNVYAWSVDRAQNGERISIFYMSCFPTIQNPDLDLTGTDKPDPTTTEREPTSPGAIGTTRVVTPSRTGEGTGAKRRLADTRTTRGAPTNTPSATPITTAPDTAGATTGLTRNTPVATAARAQGVGGRAKDPRRRRRCPARALPEAPLRPAPPQMSPLPVGSRAEAVSAMYLRLLAVSHPCRRLLRSRRLFRSLR